MRSLLRSCRETKFFLAHVTMVAAHRNRNVKPPISWRLFNISQNHTWSSRIMSNSDSDKWAKLRKLGRTQYVLRYGVLGWGIPTAILFSLIQGYRFGWDGFLFQLILALI